MVVDGEDLLGSLSARAVELLDICGQIAEDRGEGAYLVGGSVRDLILGRVETDLDIVVEGDGMAVAQALARATGSALTRHHAFQTARVDTQDGFRIDVATARSETYPEPGVLPRVVEGSLHEDLERRDFTINTMAISLDPAHHGELIDPEGGVADLRVGIIRVLHSRSFADDPTRVLRALRFVERFGYRMEDHTAHQLREAVSGGYMEYVSGARVRRELSYMFSESPVEGPLVLQNHGVLRAVREGLGAERSCLESLAENRAWHAQLLAQRDTSLTEAGREAADATATGSPGTASPRLENSAVVDPDWALVLSACAIGLAGQERWDLAGYLGLSRGEREPLIESGPAWERARGEWDERVGEARQAAVVVDAIFSRFNVGTLLVQLSVPETKSDDDLVAGLRGFLTHTRWVRPDLRGGDLIGLGVPRGPSVGDVLEHLRRARVDGSISDEEGERRWVLEWLDHRAREEI